jgi:hypothetical protein
MKRRTRCSGITLTYSFSVATSELPAFSASQRRSVSSDQTLPTPAWFPPSRERRRWSAALRRSRAMRPWEFDQHVDRIGAGQLGVEPPLAATACCLSGTWSASGSAAPGGVDHAETADQDHRDQAEQPGRLTMRTAIQ